MFSAQIILPSTSSYKKSKIFLTKQSQLKLKYDFSNLQGLNCIKGLVWGSLKRAEHNDDLNRSDLSILMLKIWSRPFSSYLSPLNVILRLNKGLNAIKPDQNMFCIIKIETRDFST